MAKHNWTFLTSHAVVYLYLHDDPEASVRSIVDGVGLAERTAAMILADLRDDGYITVRKRGRGNAYALNLDLSIRCPSHARYRVRDFLTPLNGRTKRRGGKDRTGANGRSFTNSITR